jgi:hypothetical protein
MAYLQFLPLKVFVKVVSLVNITRKSLIRIKPWHAQEQLHLVHSDICGPLETTSLSSVVYFITIIDYYSKKTWVYLLKHTSEAYVVFQEFKALVEKELGKYIKTLRTNNALIQLAIGGHPPIPIGSSCLFLVQHILLYFFVIVGSTLLGLSEALHIFQVDIGGLSPNPTGLFCMFSCQHILLYFQGHFGGLNNVFLARHSQIVDEVEFEGRMCSSLKYLSNGLSHT